MDGCSRQNPAYRPATEKPRSGGVFLCALPFAPPRRSLPTVRAVAHPLTVVSLLDADAALADAVPPAQQMAARASCRAPLVRVARGSWQTEPQSDGLLGYLIVDGMISREAALRSYQLVELLGPGDVLHASAQREHGGGLEARVHVILDSLVMPLGPQLIAAATHWPAILIELQARFEQQHDRLVTQALIAHLPRSVDRLLFMLWHIADSWGRVTPEGVVVPLRLTHAVLGRLVAARRSTVTLAVTELQDAGHVRRMEDGSWLLNPDSRPNDLDRTEGLPQAVGRFISVRERNVQLRAESAAVIAQARQLKAHRRA